MSATNQTPNYGLPQYIGTDVPSYLGDFNKAMLDIDTAIKGVDNKATSAESSVATANANASEALENANTASTKADTAQATATSAKTTAETAQTTATQAQTTAETAQTTATQAQTTANTANQKADQIMDWSEAINVGSDAITQGNLLLSYNLGIKCFTIFGAFSFNTQTGETVIGHLPDESLYPVTDRTVYNIAQEVGSGYGSQSIVFKTNGDIVYNAGSPTNLALRMNAFVNFSFWKTA